MLYSILKERNSNGTGIKIYTYFFILNIFIVLRYTYMTPVGTGSRNQGLGKDDLTPLAGYGHHGI